MPNKFYKKTFSNVFEKKEKFAMIKHIYNCTSVQKYFFFFHQIVQVLNCLTILIQQFHKISPLLAFYTKGERSRD